MVQLTNFVDYAKQKQADEKLKNTRELYLGVMDSVMSGIVISDGDGRIHFANRSFARIAGVKTSELIKKCTWYDFVLPEDLVKAKSITEKILLENRRTSISDTIRLVDRKRLPRTFFIAENKLPDSDSLLCLFVDLTEKLRIKSRINEQRLKFELIFEEVNNALFVVNQQGLIEKINKAGREFSNYMLAGAVGKHFYDVIDSYGLPNVLKKMLVKRKRQFFPEIKINGTDGRIYWFNMTSVWIRESGIKKGYWIIVGDDVSSQVELSQIKANLSHVILEAREKERRVISQEIHDTLGQALAVYKMDAHRLSADAGISSEETEGRLKQLNEIIETSRNLARSIRSDILNNLGLLGAIKHDIADKKKQNDVKIESNISVKHLNFGLHGNLQIFRVIQEAMRNAIKHSQASEITLTISKINTYYIFLVKDNGKGFNVDELTDNQHTNHLGLRIMKERCDDIGAELLITSHINKGTIVRVRYRPHKEELWHN